MIYRSFWGGSKFFRIILVLCLLTPAVMSCKTTTQAKKEKEKELAAKKKDEKADDKDKDKDKDKKPKLKKYEEVVTKDAVTKKGLFIVHKVDDNLYYEIPTNAFGIDMLWVVQISETTAGSSFAGMPAGDRVVRWELHDDHVFLRDVRYGIRADTNDAVAEAVKASNLAPIIRSFDVKAYSTNKSPVIDVTDLFRKDVAEISARRSLHAGAMDNARSFIAEFKAFPENVNVRVLASFAAGKSSGGPPGEEAPESSGITALICHSMVKLPEKPMKPRRFDSRVGFFTESFTDYSDKDEHAAEDIQYILRWRLEKKDPDAKISEPVKPIVFYVSREVPDKWKSYVKAGIEAWEPAFETAGFTNAIIGKYAPDPKDEPDWDVEDARISSIRWVPASIENAFGPQVHDPRTGEILSADVRMFHNVEKLIRDWYFVQASPNDERAQKFPLPDDLEGELIRFVVAHEVGHSLGFPHNMKASSSYTIAQLRDPEWTKKNGTAASVMDYARYNYVAQPGDGAGLLPKVGPYDYFAVNWGYREFPKFSDEKVELEKIVKVQIENPIYRFGDPNPTVDSTQQTEDLGSNAVEATTLGLKNLERVAGYIVKATSKPGKDYELLENEYEALLRQWLQEMNHVANVVGGVEEINLYYGDANKRFFPNPASYQQEAVTFLVKNALTTPTKFIGDDIVLRLTAEGVAQRVLSAQSRLLRNLTSSQRVDRMSEIAQDATNAVYSPEKLFFDLRAGLFNELSSRPVDIDLYRRNLQRTYVDMLAGNIKPPLAANSDLPAYSRAELEAIRDWIKTADLAQAKPVVQMHLKDLTARITRALDNRRTDEEK